MTGPVPVVVLATADFNSAVWTNKQHLAVRLAEGRPVVYLESFGLRRPTFTLSDVRRVLRRLRPRRAPPAADGRPAARVPVIAPVVIPLHGSRAVRRLNGWLVRRFVRPKLPDEYVLWTFGPLTYGLEHGATAVVYHSVDLIHHQPHMPERTLVSAERRLVRRADAVLASSTGVRDHLTALGARDVALWENVADTRLFADRRAQRRPVAVFAGHLTPTKIDIGLLQQVVDSGSDLVVCGPLPGDGTQLPADMRALLDHPRTDYRGNRSPEELAEVFAECRVGLIPYLLTPYTRGVFPLKVYEYLASGLTVLSTPLPSMADVPEEFVERPSHSRFATAVRRAVEQFDERSADARRAFSGGHSWEARAAQAEALLAALGSVEPSSPSGSTTSMSG